MLKALGYSPYQSYKDTGVDWIEQIPAGWTTKKAKFLLVESNSRSVSGDEHLLSLSKYHGVIRKDQMSERAGQAESLVGYKEVEAGDLVINKMQASNGLMAVSEITGITSPDYAIYRAKKNGVATAQFICHVLRQPEYLAEIKRRAKGVMEGFIRLYTDDLFDLPILIPSLREQQSILDFLEDKCTKIDESLRIKEDQIALLRERRQIIIQDAVTRGLNPSAPMKDSGIDWIGQIPAHWEVKRNKHMFIEVNERSAKGAEQHLSMSQKLGLVPANQVEKSLVSESYEGAKLVRVGDLVLNRLKAHLAVFSIAPMEGLVSPDYSVFRPFVPGASSRYYESLFKTSKYLGEFRLRVRGIVEGFYRLYTDSFMDIPLLIPPQDEQDEIVSRLDMLSAKFEDAIFLKNSQIAALKEYKTSLINAAVTGKIKVI